MYYLEIDFNLNTNLQTVPFNKCNSLEDIKVFLPQINSGPDSAKHVITKDFNEAAHALKAKGVLEHFAELGPCCIATALIAHIVQFGHVCTQKAVLKTPLILLNTSYRP